MRTEPVGATRTVRRVAAAAAAATLVMVAGCGGGDQPGDPASPSESPATSAPPAASPGGPDTEVEFVFEEPSPLCPEPARIASLPQADEHVLVDPQSEADDVKLRQWCTYTHTDVAADGVDTVLADHVQITSELTLFRDWSDSDWSDTYPELPISATDPAEWSVAVLTSGDHGVWSEDDGQARTYAWQTQFAAHAGDLELYVTVAYVAEELPADVEARTIAIFRDLAIAAMQDRGVAD